MRTYDKLIATIFARQAKGSLRPFPGDRSAAYAGDLGSFAASQGAKFGRMWMQATRGTDSFTATVVNRESDTAPAGASKVSRSPWARG